MDPLIISILPQNILEKILQDENLSKRNIRSFVSSSKKIVEWFNTFVYSLLVEWFSSLSSDIDYHIRSDNHSPNQEGFTYWYWFSIRKKIIIIPTDEHLYAESRPYSMDYYFMRQNPQNSQNSYEKEKQVDIRGLFEFLKRHAPYDYYPVNIGVSSNSRKNNNTKTNNNSTNSRNDNNSTNSQLSIDTDEITAKFEKIMSYFSILIKIESRIQRQQTQTSSSSQQGGQSSIIYQNKTRKVYKDKDNKKYIKFNNTNIYLSTIKNKYSYTK